MRDTEKSLFIPLHKKFYKAFKDGSKTVEYRRYGTNWNENTCHPGRRVVLSCGYGKKNRCEGVVTRMWESPRPWELPGWVECYGSNLSDVACCIEIKLDPKP